MKLLIVNYEYPPLGGGGGVGTAILAAAVAAAGHRVTVLTSGIDSRSVSVSVEDAVQMVRVPVWGRQSRASASFISMLTFIISAIAYVWRNRRTLEFDLVNTHFAIPTGPAGAAIARILRLPHIITLVGGEIYDQPLETTGYKNPLIPLLTRIIAHSATGLTAISSDTRQGAERLVHIRKAIEVVPYGFEVPSDFRPQPRPRGIPNDFYIVSAGRLVPRKGFDILIRALARVADLSWTVTIMGDGEEKECLKVLAHSLGIADRVSFTGFTSRDLFWQEMQRAHLFALASYHEGLGLVYQEAMYCGLPIVTTSNGGQVDFLSDPRNALLVPIGDPGAFAQALRCAMCDTSWFLQASENNLQDIRLLYMDRLLPKWVSTFEKFIGE